MGEQKKRRVTKATHSRILLAVPGRGGQRQCPRSGGRAAPSGEMPVGWQPRGLGNMVSEAFNTSILGRWLYDLHHEIYKLGYLSLMSFYV